MGVLLRLIKKRQKIANSSCVFGKLAVKSKGVMSYEVYNGA
jgi:hypothetical protein